MSSNVKTRNQNGSLRKFGSAEILLLSVVVLVAGCASHEPRDRTESSIKASKPATETALDTVAEMGRLYPGNSEQRK